jgi:hypothetical protein
MTIRALYSDLDGTLLGPGGSLFSTTRGDPTLAAAEAILALQRAEVQLVLVSGRTQGQMSEMARMLSASAYIAEMGALVVDRNVFPEETHRNFGGFAGKGTPFERIVRSGAGAFLLDTYRGALEPHTPWSAQAREATMLFRGQIDLDEARAGLARAGYDWLELNDNGVILRKFQTLVVPEVHAYHLVPKGVSKATGVMRHLELSDIAPAEAAAVGDSDSDLEMATTVGQMFITANGRDTVGELPANARFTRSPHGEGFAEVVEELLH